MSLATQLRLLRSRVGPLFTQKGLDFKVEYVTSIRDWNSCTPKISTLYGAYRRPSKKDTTVVPHSFTFIRRDCTLPEILNILLFCIGPWKFIYIYPFILFKLACLFITDWGMPSTLLEDAEERLPSWYNKTGDDVFVLVKAFLSDSELSQKPLLILPGCKGVEMMAAIRRLAKPNAPCI